MKRAFLLLLFLLPLPSLASVGFTSDPVWLSASPAYEGEKMTIYASLTNSSHDELRAVAYFRDNGTLIDSTPVRLSPGEAKIVSISWTPTKGKHTLAVEIASSTIQLPAKTKTTSVEVIEKKEAVPVSGLLADREITASASYSDSSSIQNAIGTLSPVIQTYTSPLFGFIDTWRHTFTDYLGLKTEKAKNSIADAANKKQSLAGKEDAESEKANRQALITQISQTLLLYVFEAIAFLLANAYVSYALLLLLICYAGYRVYRYFRPVY